MKQTKWGKLRDMKKSGNFESSETELRQGFFIVSDPPRKHKKNHTKNQGKPRRKNSKPTKKN